MAAPEYVPVLPQDRPRRAEELPPAVRWVPNRPGDFALATADQPAGAGLGTPGPDQGYALKLARRFEDKLQLAAGEHPEDAVAGCLGVATKRSALFGRAPVIYDLELAFTLWGFLADAPPDLVSFRKPLFEAARHHYWDLRAISDRVPESTLRLSPEQVRSQLADWKNLLVT